MKNKKQNAESLTVMKRMASAYRSKNYGDVVATRFGLRQLINNAPDANVSKAARKLTELSYSRLGEEFLRRHVPADFQDCDAAAHPSPRALEQVLSLPMPDSCDEHGEPKKVFCGGIILHGSKQAGTTNAAFAMLSRWVRSGSQVRFQHHTAHELVQAFGNAASEVIFERYLADADEILFIDDLSGTRFCKASASNFFEFVTQIVRRQKIVVVTVDLAGDDLARHWSALDPRTFGICQDIVGRLRDYSVGIHFAPGEKAA